MLLASRLASCSKAVLYAAPPTERRGQPSQRRPSRAGKRIDPSRLRERWPSVQWLQSRHACVRCSLAAAVANSAGATRGASEAAVAKAAVARVRTVAPAAEGPLTLARAARASRPRCCQEWAASLEPQAAAAIARRAIRIPRSRCCRRTSSSRSWSRRHRNRRRSTPPSRCPCGGVNWLSAAVGACRSRRSRCRTGHPGTRRPGRRRRSSHPRHKLTLRCE